MTDHLVAAGESPLPATDIERERGGGVRWVWLRWFCGVCGERERVMMEK